METSLFTFDPWPDAMIYLPSGNKDIFISDWQKEFISFVGLNPPLRKYVKKINSCKVQKENLFDPPAGGELFSFSGMN